MHYLSSNSAGNNSIWVYNFQIIQNIPMNIKWQRTKRVIWFASMFSYDWDPNSSLGGHTRHRNCSLGGIAFLVGVIRACSKICGCNSENGIQMINLHFPTLSLNTLSDEMCRGLMKCICLSVMLMAVLLKLSTWHDIRKTTTYRHTHIHMSNDIFISTMRFFSKEILHLRSWRVKLIVDCPFCFSITR